MSHDGFRGVIPLELRSRVLALLHEGHAGIVRTKLLVRSLVWWPSINADVELMGNNCPECLRVNFKQKSDYIPWPAAKFPFERIHLDFFRASGFDLIFFCDAYSKWVDAKVLPDLTANSVIECLLSLFAFWGLPRKMVSDNGPPFTSFDYTEKEMRSWSNLTSIPLPILVE